jgi:Domain of unknown function (DUF4279)
MTDQEIIAVVEAELKEPSQGTTEQYLEIHAPVRDGLALSVARIDRDRSDGIVVVYLPVENQAFHFAVYVNENQGAFTGMHTEPYNRVYFRATSEELSLDQLKSMTTLTPTGGWNKGDLRPNGRSAYNFSSLKLMPNPEPDAFDDKLRNLLTFLEKDRSGVKELATRANGYVQVAQNYHNGNGMIGGIHLDRDCINRMNGLGLEIDFDLYVEGNEFIS